MDHGRFRPIALASLFVSGAVCGLASGVLEGSARADTVTTVVTPRALAGWYADRANATYLHGSSAPLDFVRAPDPAAVGVGSLFIGSGADANEGAYLRHEGFAGKRLADLSELSYRTYIRDNGTCNAPFLVLSLDINGDGRSDDRLAFEPCYQDGAMVPNQGAVRRGAWQTWDARAGGWWLRTGGPPVFTLATYLKDHPDATLVDAGGGALRLAGGLGVVLSAYVDDLRIGFSGQTQRFDFEPQIGPPRAVSDCQNDGWRQFNTPVFQSEESCARSLDQPDLLPPDLADPVDAAQPRPSAGCQAGGAAPSPLAGLLLVGGLLILLRRRSAWAQSGVRAAAQARRTARKQTL